MPSSRGFQNLFQSSRLASLARPLKNKFISPNHPTHQIIGTAPSSFFRHDWGIKRGIPGSAKSLYITLDVLDSNQGWTKYSPGSGNYRKIQRFRELGVSLIPSKYQRKDALLKNDVQVPESLKYMDSKKISSYLQKASHKRDEFRRWLFDKEHATVQDLNSSAVNVTTHVEKFLGLSASNDLKVPPRNSIKATAGLDYSVKGGLRNSPQGVNSYKKVKGRVVDGPMNIFAAGVGGFVTKASLSNIVRAKTVGNRHKAESVHDFIVVNAYMLHNGSVEMNTQIAEIVEGSQVLMKSLQGGNRVHRPVADRNIVNSFVQTAPISSQQPHLAKY